MTLVSKPIQCRKNGPTKGTFFVNWYYFFAKISYSLVWVTSQVLYSLGPHLIQCLVYTKSTTNTTNEIDEFGLNLVAQPHHQGLTHQSFLGIVFNMNKNKVMPLNYSMYNSSERL